MPFAGALLFGVAELPDRFLCNTHRVEKLDRLLGVMGMAEASDRSH